MSANIEKTDATAPHIERAITPADDAFALDGAAKASDYKGAAIEAENAEHNMGVLQAAKEYPMAAMWAFIMSCTIVRAIILSWTETVKKGFANTINRSWNRIVSS